MECRFETINKKDFIGKRMVMSLTNNKTRELWHGLMTRRKEIKNNIGSDLYSIQFYKPRYFTPFNPSAEFEKWAAIEVKDFNEVPPGMEMITITGALYAVFIYKGRATEAAPSFQYIFTTWLPSSGYLLDDRPHFEILGAKYINDHPDSEEEIWIPIKTKTINPRLCLKQSMNE